MSDKFIASNGIAMEVEPDDDAFLSNLPGVYGNFSLKGSVTKALREYFQHERDTELGRWRWPENPDYVVYPQIVPGHEQAFGPDLSVMVFHEPTGVLKGYCRSEDEGGNQREYPRAARAYFAAHPEPKLLSDAGEGEAWLIEWYDEGAFQPILILNRSREFVFRDGSRFKLNHPGVRSARRIWPELADG